MLLTRLERWWEHFTQVSNVEVDEKVLSTVLKTAPVSSPSAATNDHLLSVPCESEIRTALKMMKNGRAPGADDISAELLKLGGEKVVQWLTHLARIVWEKEKVPEDWVKQLTIPLHKKGPFHDCDNFRGIALFSVPGKVLCKVTQERVADRVEKMLGKVSVASAVVRGVWTRSSHSGS